MAISKMIDIHLTYPNFWNIWMNSYWKFQPLRVNLYFKNLKRLYGGWHLPPTPCTCTSKGLTNRYYIFCKTDTLYADNHTEWMFLCLLFYYFIFSLPWDAGFAVSVEAQFHYSEQLQGDTASPFSGSHLLYWEKINNELILANASKRTYMYHRQGTTSFRTK